MGKNRRAIPVENKFRRQWEAIDRARCLKFMEDLLIATLQFLFEFAVEVLSNVPFDWPSSRRTWPEKEGIAGECFIWFIVGGVLAYISTLLLKYTWISFSWLRIVNLVLAPITSALISQAIARRRSRHNPNIVPRNHFWRAFWFTLGIVTVRFAYAVRH
jgi:hypothetical protein